MLRKAPTVARRLPRPLLLLIGGSGVIGSATSCGESARSCVETFTCSNHQSGGAGTGAIGGTLGASAGTAGTGGTAGAGTGGTAAGGGTAGTSIGESGQGGRGGATGSAGTTSSTGGRGAGGTAGENESGAGGEGGSVEPPACSPDEPCGIGEGPCTSNEDCARNLSCGFGDGPKLGLAGDICLPSHCTNDVADYDETSVDCGSDCGCPDIELLSDAASCARDVSADGSFVLGWDSDEGGVVRWDASGNAVLVPSGGNAYVEPLKLSASGSTIVGGVGGDSMTAHPVIWSGPNLDIYDLGPSVPELTESAFARAVSDDGSVVAGDGYDGTTFRGFRWSLAGGADYLALPDLSSTVSDISGDGRAVVGSQLFEDYVRAFLWYEDGTSAVVSGLGTGLTGVARAVSRDGSTVVGTFAGIQPGEPFRSGPPNGFTGLGSTGGAVASISVMDVTEDGGTVIGWDYPQSGSTPHPFIWDQSGGLRDLMSDLATKGFEAFANELLLGETNAISADGNVIVGCLRGPNGNRAYRLTLNP